MPPVIFQVSDEVLNSMSRPRRSELELAVAELNEDTAEAGIEGGGAAIMVGRGPQGGLSLTREGIALPLNRQEFDAASSAYAAAMDRLSRACASPVGAQNLQRLDEAKGRVHKRGAALVASAVSKHVELDEPLSKRLFTVAYLIVTGASASRVIRHGLDTGAS